MMRRLWPFSLGTFALGLDAYVLAGLLPAMAHDLHTSQAMVGLGVAIFTAAYAISAPALSSVAARYSTRVALLAGMTLFTVGNLATMVAPSLTILLVARMIAGVGAGLFSPVAASSAAGMVESDQRGRALSMVLAGLSMGTAFGVPLGLAIEASLSWRWTIGLIALLGIVAALGVTLYTETFPVTNHVAWRSRLAALKAPFNVLTLAVTLLTGIASLGLYTYMAEITMVRGMSQFTGMFIWLWGLGGMTGALTIGRVIDRSMPPRSATLVLLGLLGISFFLVGYTPLVATAAGCFLWGLAGWASITPQQHALVTHDANNAVAAIAWNSSANYLGGAIGAASGSMLLAAHLSASWLPAASLAATTVAVALHLLKTRRLCRLGA
ncbi:MAG: MFS transporter [Burkholderiaceae bacterium]